MTERHFMESLCFIESKCSSLPQESCSNEYPWVQSKPTCVNPACFDLFRCARVSFAISRGNSERNLEPSNRPMVLLGQEIWAQKTDFHHHFAWEKPTLHYNLQLTRTDLPTWRSAEQICQCLSSKVSRSPTSTTSKSKRLGSKQAQQVEVGRTLQILQGGR